MAREEICHSGDPADGQGKIFEGPKHLGEVHFDNPLVSPSNYDRGLRWVEERGSGREA